MTEVLALDPINSSFECVDGVLLGSDYARPMAPVPEGLSGAASRVRTDNSGRVRLVRDPLGINKIFWAVDADGAILVSSRPLSLVRAGIDFEHVRALPPGVVVDLDADGGAVDVRALAPDLWDETPADHAPADPAAVAEAIHTTLHAYAAGLAETYGDRDVFVCLSGGQDSTAAMLVAREHFPDLTAVSFDLERDDGDESEDRRVAERLARDFDLPLLRVTVTPEEMLGHLDVVLTDGVDWRDFNVHAGLINAAMAEAIANTAPAGPEDRAPLVITGDLMNELLADYHQETYRGQTYYRLPPLSPLQLRKVLVRGAETSHREVGVFEAWGLHVVQLYAAAARLYLSLGEEFIGDGDGKQRVNRLVFGDDMPAYVLDRAKTRAQVGDARTGRGVLAAVTDRGIDRGWLADRFAALHDVQDTTALNRFIRAGRYRSGIPTVNDSPAGTVS